MQIDTITLQLKQGTHKPWVEGSSPSLATFVLIANYPHLLPTVEIEHIYNPLVLI
jgi:hypothetical protein